MSARSRLATLVAASMLLGLVALPTAQAGDGEDHTVVLYWHYDDANPAILESTVTTNRVLDATEQWNGTGDDPFKSGTFNGDGRWRFYVTPGLDAPLTIGPQIDAHVWMAGRIVGTGGEMHGNFDLSVYEVSDDGSGNLEQTAIGATAIQITGVAIPQGNPDNKADAQDVSTYAPGQLLRFNLGVEGFTHTVQPGNTLLFDLHFHPTGQLSEYAVYFDSAAAPTHFTFQTADTASVADLTAINDDTGASIFPSDWANVTFTADVLAPLGEYDIASVMLDLEGPGGAILTDEILAAAGPEADGITPYTYAWPYSSMTPGEYTATVTATDTAGNTGTRTIQFGVGIDLQAFNATVGDGHNDTLAGAPYRIYSGGVAIADGVTDENGSLSEDLTNGTYSLGVWWQDVQVANETFSVSGATEFNATAEVYRPVLHAVDDAGDPAEGVAIFIGHPNGTSSLDPVYTDADGNATLGLSPIGDYDLTAWWRGIAVNDTRLAIDGAGPYVLNASMHTLRVHVAADDLDLDFEDGRVDAYDARGFLAGSATIDADGNASLVLPADDYTIVASWRGVPVNATDLTLSGSTAMNLTATVYAVPFHVTDRDGDDLAGARVEAAVEEGVVATGVTDADGIATLTLPADTYQVTTYWLGILVDEADATVENATTVALSAAAGDVAIQVTDAHGRALGSALVLVSGDAEPMASGSTDSAGTLTLRLPDGEHDATVSWLGVIVAEESLSGDATLETDVYDLKVTLKDEDGEAFAGAAVRARLQGGEVLAASHTDTSGATVLRLPGGTYEVEVRHQWTYLWKHVDHAAGTTVTLDDSLEVAFTEEKPSAVGTPGGVLSGLAVLGGIGGGYLYWTRREG